MNYESSFKLLAAYLGAEIEYYQDNLGFKEEIKELQQSDGISGYRHSFVQTFLNNNCALESTKFRSCALLPQPVLNDCKDTLSLESDDLLIDIRDYEMETAMAIVEWFVYKDSWHEGKSRNEIINKETYLAKVLHTIIKFVTRQSEKAYDTVIDKYNFENDCGWDLDVIPVFMDALYKKANGDMANHFPALNETDWEALIIEALSLCNGRPVIVPTAEEQATPFILL